ncbi:MAG: cellulase family glycosylhydrolase, partial [Actinomycetota bacterium]
PAPCTPGYRQTDVWGTDYRSYVVQTVARYRDNPTIAFWQLMNEPLYNNAGASDPTALVDFARDMGDAIRVDAGDAYHLVNLGTPQATFTTQQYKQLLDCSSSSPSGCTDLTEVHDYSGEPLQGTPLDSSVTVRYRQITASTSSLTPAVVVPIDAWADASSGTPAPQTNWELVVSAPSSNAWPLYVDDVTVGTAAGPVTYGFETGTDGFTASPGVTLSRTATYAHGGASSMRVLVPAGVTDVTLTPPVPASAILSVQASVRAGFAAPAADGAKGIAPLFHSAVVTQNKPIFTGEAGIAAAVPSLTPASTTCPGTSLDQRATMFNEMLKVQTDDNHRSSGFLLWDFNDPTVQSTTANGTPQVDRNFGCYSVSPADPTVAVMKTWSDTLAGGIDPLPAPAALVPAALSFVTLTGPPERSYPGASIPLRVRMTSGGNLFAGARMIADGGCVGSGATNSLGIAAFSCAVSPTLGPTTITLSVDPTTCDCSLPSEIYPFTVDPNTTITIGVTSAVVQRGTGTPITLTLSAPPGGSLLGAKWSVPECWLGGTIRQDVRTAVVSPVCPPLDAGTSSTWVLTAKATDTLGKTYSVPFVTYVFDRIYADPATNDCVGVSLDIRTVGATSVPGGCRAGAYGPAAGWFAFKVPTKETVPAFSRNGSKLHIAAAGATHQIDGQFEYADAASRTFSAIITDAGNSRMARNESA